MNAIEQEVDGLPFLEKLTTVYDKGELDFWEDRINPPNLSKDEFDLVLNRVTNVENLKWLPRKSKNGPHGLTGEDNCFMFNCPVEFGGIFENTRKLFFVKGYFSTKKI